MTTVINIFGGPGIGKSTTSAHIFYELKRRHISCELAQEYAKDLVWEGNGEALSDQLYVFGHQHFRIFRLLGKVDYIITDSPFLLSIIYDGEQREHLEQLALKEFKKLNSINILLLRDTIFQENGRYHTEEESVMVDNRIKQLLLENQIDFIECLNKNVMDHLSGLIFK